MKFCERALCEREALPERSPQHARPVHDTHARVVNKSTCHVPPGEAPSNTPAVVQLYCATE